MSINETREDYSPPNLHVPTPPAALTRILWNDTGLDLNVLVVLTNAVPVEFRAEFLNTMRESIKLQESKGVARIKIAEQLLFDVFDRPAD